MEVSPAIAVRSGDVEEDSSISSPDNNKNKNTAANDDANEDDVDAAKEGDEIAGEAAATAAENAQGNNRADKRKRKPRTEKPCACENMHCNKELSTEEVSFVRVFRRSRPGVDSTLCRQCALKFRNGAFCINCEKFFEKRNDEPEIWIGCDTCSRWFHQECAPDVVPPQFFSCTVCTDASSVWREDHLVPASVGSRPSRKCKTSAMDAVLAMRLQAQEGWSSQALPAPHHRKSTASSDSLTSYKPTGSHKSTSASAKPLNHSESTKRKQSAETSGDREITTKAQRKLQAEARNSSGNAGGGGSLSGFSNGSEAHSAASSSNGRRSQSSAPPDDDFNRMEFLLLPQPGRRSVISLRPHLSVPKVATVLSLQRLLADYGSFDGDLSEIVICCRGIQMPPTHAVGNIFKRLWPKNAGLLVLRYNLGSLPADPAEDDEEIARVEQLEDEPV